MSARPAVTVLMPVRDGERWLGEALESVLSQSLGDFGLIVVDDGSRDGTAAILADHARRDARMRVIRQPAQGLVTALNRGLDAADAPLVARLDADDAARTDRLAKQCAVFADRPHLVLLGSWAERIDAFGNVTGELRPETDSGRLAALLPTANPFIHSSVMFRTDAARRLGGYRAAFEAAEDYDLWLRMAEAGPVANLPEALIRYRVHPGGVTGRRAVRQLFSARLAQAASRERRRTGTDPAEGLAAPPDWNAPEADSSFHAEASRVARLLALADEDGVGEDALATLPSVAGQLTHRERALAQEVLWTLLHRPGTPLATRVRLFAWCVRLHPPRAAARLLGRRPSDA